MTGVKCLHCSNGRMVVAKEKDMLNNYYTRRRRLNPSRKKMVILRCNICGKEEVF